MSFDQNEGVPLVDVAKPASKVNIWMVIVIVAFVGFGVFTYLTL